MREPTGIERLRSDYRQGPIPTIGPFANQADNKSHTNISTIVNWNVSKPQLKSKYLTEMPSFNVIML